MKKKNNRIFLYLHDSTARQTPVCEIKPQDLEKPIEIAKILVRLEEVFSNFRRGHETIGDD